MPNARNLPPLNTDKATMLGPFALPFTIGYSMFKLGAEMSMAWSEMLFASPGQSHKDERTLPVPDPLDKCDDPELFA